MQGAPVKELRSEFTPGPAPDRARGVGWLHVANNTRFTVALRVDGRRVGRLGPYAAAGFFVGRTAAAERSLNATCDAGRWEATMRDGDITWHLYE